MGGNCQGDLSKFTLVLCLHGAIGRTQYSKMSNNVPDKIKPFGTLRDFRAGHLGHYETFLYGHRLGPFGTLRDFFLGHYKTSPPPYLKAGKFFLPGALRPSRPPGGRIIVKFFKTRKQRIPFPM